MSRLIAILLPFMLAGTTPSLAETRGATRHAALLVVGETLEPSAPGILAIDQILVDGTPITINKVFAAPPGWLDRLSMRVTNMSTKPIVYFGLGVGLLPTPTDQLAPYESWRYGYGYLFGHRMTRKAARAATTRLEPGDSVVVSAADMSPESRRVLERDRVLEEFGRAEIWTAEVQYADGRTQSGGVGFIRVAETDPVAQQPN